MQPQTLIKLLPFIAALASAAPVNGEAAVARRGEDLAKYCNVVLQTVDTPASVDCKIPDLTDADIDAVLAGLDPKYCSRTADGIDCSLSKSAPQVKRSIDDIELIALPIVIGSGPVSVQRRQTQTVTPASTVPIPKDLVLAGTLANQGAVVGKLGGGNLAGIEIEYKFKLGKDAAGHLEQLGNPAIINAGTLVKPALSP